ncbi:hypothetical protein EOD39_9734 [Acipenser ruthenus]|uniref:Uncharacterized protein n=1 Tax=Acipenser ruthenus TaxID=7906 RepID=A0A444TZZ9_ACIRT|nr:hypothetical protein EOD39_9734 [Acipenser ruthenus]
MFIAKLQGSFYFTMIVYMVSNRTGVSTLRDSDSILLQMKLLLKINDILLSVCGCKTYNVIRNLTAPNSPSSKSYVELVELLKTHFQPKPSVIMQHFIFNTRVRTQGEFIATFVANLKQLTEYCAFGEALNDMLRDRLLCGVNDNAIQLPLLAESNIDFKHTFYYKISIAMESPAK